MIPACLPTPDPSSPNFLALFCADSIRLVEASNIHKHSDTCYKYWKTRHSEKKTCRMRMPRQLGPMSTIDPDTSCISMKRSDPWINHFNDYLIAAVRSNIDIKFIRSGSDAKALVHHVTDYVTKMDLSFHDTLSLVQNSIASMSDASNQNDTSNVIEKSRKLILRCYNTLASQQELSGVQVASYLMNWDDHYTSHRFQGVFLIQIERHLQSKLNELRSKNNIQIELENGLYFLCIKIVRVVNIEYFCLGLEQHNISDDGDIDKDSPNEEQFNIQLSETEDQYILINTRVDNQYRSDVLDKLCLYDFFSMLYKKKMNAGDKKYLLQVVETNKDTSNRRGRPVSKRYRFQKEHPQTTTYLLIEHSEPQVPVLYGPQIPRKDREDARERYCRAPLTLFVPWGTVHDLSNVDQT